MVKLVYLQICRISRVLYLELVSKKIKFGVAKPSFPDVVNKICYSAPKIPVSSDFILKAVNFLLLVWGASLSINETRTVGRG